MKGKINYTAEELANILLKSRACIYVDGCICIDEEWNYEFHLDIAKALLGDNALEDINKACEDINKACEEEGP